MPLLPCAHLLHGDLEGTEAQVLLEQLPQRLGHVGHVLEALNTFAHLD